MSAGFSFILFWSSTKWYELGIDLWGEPQERIYYRQDAQHPARRQLVVNEVYCPHIIRPNRWRATLTLPRLDPPLERIVA